MSLLHRPAKLAALLVTALGAASCENADLATYTDLRVYDNPYASVDWSNDLRLKAQHHDHLAFRSDLIQAYDDAGYDVLSLMDYSGAPDLRFSLRVPMWPPEDWVPHWLLTNLNHVKFFVPNAEEIGLGRKHVTAPFMMGYIEHVESVDAAVDANGRALPDNAVIDPETQFSDLGQMFKLIRRKGGVPCLAHPWSYGYEPLTDLTCVEIFNAYAEAEKFWGAKPFVDVDRNAELIANWDRALQVNQRIHGIAVNDHFGPGGKEGKVPDTVLDSGKIIVLAPEATLEAYQARFIQGAILAIRDTAAVKDLYPRVESIVVGEASLYIETRGAVTWISAGAVIGTGPLLMYSDFPPNTRYVRAEIAGENGSVVYTQAFQVRPVQDADGNYSVDIEDYRLCSAVALGAAVPRTVVAACRAAGDSLP